MFKSILFPATGFRTLFGRIYPAVIPAVGLVLASCSNVFTTSTAATDDANRASVAGTLAGPVALPPTTGNGSAINTSSNEPDSTGTGSTTTGSTGDSGYIAPPSGGDSGNDTGYINPPSKLVVQPGSYNFQMQSIGSITRAQFTVQNVGGQYATNIAPQGLVAPYSFAGGTYPGVGATCSNTLAPQATCTMIVTFSPTTDGIFQLSTFALSYDSGVLSIPLNGGGTDIATLNIIDEVDNNSYYNYGTLAFGTSVVHKFMVQYWGGVPATGVAFTGLSGAFTIVSNQCGTAVSANCELQISYNGSWAGASQQKLKLTYNNSAYAAEADFIVMGTTTAEVTPATLSISSAVAHNDFGKVLLGSSADLAFTVTKGGTLPATNVLPQAFLSNNFVYKGGTFPGIGGSCSSTITANCTLVLTFKPTQLGTETDQIQVAYFDGENAQEAVANIQGEGAQPAQLTVTSPNSGDFGNIPVNQAAEVNFTITNVAPNSVNAVGINATGVTVPFTVVSSSCSAPLASGASCAEVIKFVPTQAGPVNGQMNIVYFDGQQSQTISTPLSGTGTSGAVINFTSTGINLGNVIIGSSQTIEVDVGYYGVLTGGNCTTSGVGSGPTGGNFVFNGGSPGNGGTCTSQINSPCKYEITFYPTDVTTYSTTFTLTYEDGTGNTKTTSITLSGSGIAETPALLTLSTPSVSFGNQVVNSKTNQTINVHRSGDLSASGLTITGLSAPYSVVGGTCGTTIANYVSDCNIVVGFNPTSAGTFGPQTLTLTYGTGLATAQTSTTLTGSAYNAAQLQATASNFGNVAVNATGSGSIKITNTGTLDASNFAITGSGTTLNAPFRLVSNTCGTDLPAGTSCTFTANFSPTQPGANSLSVAWTYNNGVSALQLSAAISGTGTVPLLVSANGNHSCARNIDGRLFCWGENNYGQLGVGDSTNRGDSTASGHLMSQLPAVSLGTGRYAVAISAGYWHTCAVLDDATLKCWGDNAYGQLGLGTNQPVVGTQPSDMGDNLPPVNLGSGVQVQAVSAGYTHTCALLVGGQVKCWGYNGEGQLGQGDTNNRGLSASDMGNNLLPVDLGGENVTQIAAGTGHTCALLQDGTEKCWGNNIYGQLGQGDFMNRGDEPDEMGNNLEPIELGSSVAATQITAGGGFSCAVLNDGTAKCWGRNDSGILGTYWCQNDEGQIGLCSDPSFPTPIRGYGTEEGQMGDALPAMSLGSGLTVTSLGSADSSNCAQLSDGSLKCWGDNSDGQLGQDNTTDLGTSPSQMGNALPTVNLGPSLTLAAFSTGNFHSCAVFTTGTMKCWGDNHFGELGLNSTTNEGDEAGEMGSSLPFVQLP